MFFILKIAGTDRDIRHEMEALEEEFTRLRHQFVAELSSTGHVSVDMILDSLTTLPLFLRPQYENPVQGKLSNLENLTSVGRLFRRLDPLLRYIDHPGLLNHLISLFGSDSLKQNAISYQRRIKIFLHTTTVADLMDRCLQLPGKEYPDYAKLKVKFDGDPKLYTLERLNEFRTRFASKLRLSELIFILIRCESSNSFFAIWMVHPSTIHIIIKRSKLIEGDFYLAEQILYLSIDGAQLYHQPDKVTIVGKGVCMLGLCMLLSVSDCVHIPSSLL